MTKNAKAAVMMTQNADLEIQEFPLPQVEAGCILVKITCCTICGSDVHSWSGRRATPLPIILGHEIVGEIVELGKGVTRDSGDRPLKIGDRITWTIMDSCGKCYYCREIGLPMKCRYLKKYGHDRCDMPPYFNGGFAEYCYITPGTCVIKVPVELTDEEVAPANCALATVIAGWDALQLQHLENVLIQGAGALGIYAAAVAKHHGCQKIIVTDLLEERLEFAKAFGASDVVNTSGMDEASFIDTIKDLTEGIGVDVAMEVAGVPAVIPWGLRSLRIGGRYVEVGCSFPNATFTCDASDIVWKRLSIRGIHNYDTKHLQMAVDFLASTHQQFPFGKIVSYRVGLDEVSKGLRASQAGDVMRVAVIPGWESAKT